MIFRKTILSNERTDRYSPKAAKDPRKEKEIKLGESTDEDVEEHRRRTRREGQDEEGGHAL